MQLKATGDDRLRRRFAPAEPRALLDVVEQRLGNGPDHRSRRRARRASPEDRLRVSAAVMILDWLRPAVFVWLACAAWFFGLQVILLGLNALA
jgi:hypothetical protein